MQHLAELEVAGRIGRKNGLAAGIGDLAETDVGAGVIAHAERPAGQARLAGVALAVAVLVVILDADDSRRVGRRHIDNGRVTCRVRHAGKDAGGDCLVLKVALHAVGGAHVTLRRAGL